MVIMMMMVMVVVIMKMGGKGPVGTRYQVVGDYDDNAAAININFNKFFKQGRDKGRGQTDHSNGCVHEGIACFLCLQNKQKQSSVSPSLESCLKLTSMLISGRN